MREFIPHEQFQSMWIDFLNNLRTQNLSLEAIVRSCSPNIQPQTKVITLFFHYSFHKNKAQEKHNAKDLEDMLRDIFGYDYKVEYKLDKSLQKAPWKFGVETQETVRKLYPTAHIPWAENNGNKTKPRPAKTPKPSETESPIEEIFWNALKLEHFISPQVRIGRYRVDFAIESYKIVIELDGHDFHKTKEQRTSDAERERYLQKNGWLVVRFTGTEIWRDVDGCIDDLLKIITAHSKSIR